MTTISSKLSWKQSGLRARLLRRAATGPLSRFIRDEDGVVAIEFAFLALPFITLLFGILELAMVFFVSAALDHGTSQAARLVRTGQIQEVDGKQAQIAMFRDTICENMSAFRGCDRQLRVDLVTSQTGRFVPNMLPQPPVQDPNDPNIPPTAYDCSGPRQVVVLRAEYYHPLAIPGEVTRLSNAGGNKRIIRSTTAFRNEPFPAPSGSCS